ncbi:hypothetical protein WG66_009722 [Moniliophthora roreri]|nr:hypothetical protein WG66_009722 [Moniliophthora roreri]
MYERNTADLVETQDDSLPIDTDKITRMSDVQLETHGRTNTTRPLMQSGETRRKMILKNTCTGSIEQHRGITEKLTT